jgi:hypothetical protein
MTDQTVASGYLQNRLFKGLAKIKGTVILFRNGQICELSGLN